MHNLFIQQQQLYCTRINKILADYINNIPQSELQQAMKYSLLAGGKRVRPTLIYAVGQMFGCDVNKLDNPAMAIEFIHTYSLIHDDLPAMDNDDLRRGMPTCHIKYGHANAILAGDALQTLAFSLLAESKLLSDSCRVSLIKELAQASGIMGMCLGQSLDLQAEHKTITLDELKQIHSYKTGALIKSAVRLGMLTAGDKALDYWSELSCYADAIGLAFQIQDDILDVVGDKTVMGKNNGTDALMEKNTYPLLMGLEPAKQACNDLYSAALEQLEKIPYDSEFLRQLADFVIKRNN